MNNDFDNFDDESWVSKSQVKRECHALQELGEAMTRLESSALDKIPLDDNIRDAIIAARKMKKGGALKRQIQYIGKLLRKVDDEPIRAAYEKATNPYREDIKLLHKLENWRDRLLAEGDEALGDLVNELPQVDRQHLRQLIRQAKKERLNNKPPKSSREIFQYLKQLVLEEE
ncbi:MAG: ribosome biogenesis factor YjgA [Thioalkalispiraceae bacterium]|jgi:ribosome-associated protein